METRIKAIMQDFSTFCEGCYVVIGNISITSLAPISIDKGVISSNFIAFLVF